MSEINSDAMHSYYENKMKHIITGDKTDLNLCDFWLLTKLKIKWNLTAMEKDDFLYLIWAPKAMRVVYVQARLLPTSTK